MRENKPNYSAGFVPGQDLSYLLMKKPEPKPAQAESVIANVLDTKAMAEGLVKEWEARTPERFRNSKRVNEARVEDLATLIDKAIQFNNVMIAESIEKEAVAVVRTNFGATVPEDRPVEQYKDLVFNAPNNPWPTARAFFRVANFIRAINQPKKEEA